jgi:hypothetical protein
LGGEVGILSRRRDKYSPPDAAAPANYAELVAMINDLNDVWVRALRRMSPPVLCELLDGGGRLVEMYFASFDPDAPGVPVDWAGCEVAPNWLDLAREYTERWHHQQQIRDAVGLPGMTEPRYLRPVLDTFVHALPHAFRDMPGRQGTAVQFRARGDAGRDWVLLREKAGWALYVGVAAAPAAEVALDQDDAWRMFTKGLRGEALRARVSLRGDPALAEKVLTAVAILG